MSKPEFRIDDETTLGIFPGTVYLITSEEKWHDTMHYLTAEESVEALGSGRAKAMIDSNGVVIYFIGVFDGSLAALVHECSHVMFYILDYVGVEIDRGAANETFCYGIDKLFGDFQEAVEYSARLQ